MTISEIVARDAAHKSLNFTGKRGFRKVLNQRVTAYLRNNGLPAPDVPAMIVKTVVALGWWLGTYLLLLLSHPPLPIKVGQCIMWALAIASVGFNVMHDSNHGSYFDNPVVTGPCL